MANSYVEFLGKGLGARVESCAARANRVIDLCDEIDVAEEILGDCLAIYAKTAAAIAAGTIEPQAAMRAMTYATDMAFSAIREVRDLKVAGSKIQVSGKFIDVGHVQETMVEFLRIVADEIGVSGTRLVDTGEVMESITARAKQELMAVDAVGVPRTQLTLESLNREVGEMHASVPEYFEPKLATE